MPTLASCVGVYLCVHHVYLRVHYPREQRGRRRRYSSGQCAPRLGFTRGRESRKLRSYSKRPVFTISLEPEAGIWNGTVSNHLEEGNFLFPCHEPRFVFPLPFRNGGVAKDLVAFDKYLQPRYSRFYINIRVGGSIRAVLVLRARNLCYLSRSFLFSFYFFFFSLCFRERYGTKGFQELLAADNWMNVSRDRVGRSMG